MKLMLLVTLSAVLSAGVVFGEESGVASLVTDPDSSHLTGVEGEPFNVSCEGAGGHCSKFSAMIWTGSDRQEITAEQRNPKSVQIGNKQFLIFTSPKVQDGGEYRCSAVYNGDQELGRKVYVEFYAQERIRGHKPKFQTSAYNVSVEQGLTVKLQCSAESKLPITYEWFNQAGDKIRSDPKKRVFVSNSSALTIRGVQPKEDEGQYICMAKNMNGLETKLYYLEVLTAEDAGVLKMVTHPGGAYVRGLAGKPVNVSCEGAGADKRKFSEPKWKTVQGEEISKGDPSVLKYGSKVILTFMNLTIDDSTSFLCTAVYDNEVELQYEVFLEIVGYKPEFPSYSQDITTDAGGWLRVSCKAQGEPPITYNWYDQNVEKITESKNSTIYATHLGDQSFLTFSDVSMEDQGTYTCLASNRYGQVNKLYAIRVFNYTGMMPEFHVSFENVTGEAGNEMELQCLAMGERPISYKWYNQEDDEISEDERSSVSVASREKYSILKFQRLSIAHWGTYTCTASNAHGLVSKVFLLNVASPKGSRSA